MPVMKKRSGKESDGWQRSDVTLVAVQIYASILVERLRKEMEAKELIPQNQMGFRKGVGTIDNIYIINYLINRQISRSRSKIVAFFVDLKAAFDSMKYGARF